MKYVHTPDGQLDRLHRSHTALAAEVVRGHEEDGESWEELLVEAGLPENALGEVRDVVDHEADRRAWHRVCEVLAHVGDALTTSAPHSASVAHALGLDNIGGETSTLSQIGARFGVSKQALSKTVRRLRAMFSQVKPLSHGRAIRRPDAPGRWLTEPECRYEFGKSGNSLRDLCARTMRTDNKRIFYDADDIERILRERAIDEAAKRAAVDREELEYRRRRRDAEQAALTAKPTIESPPPPQ